MLLSFREESFRAVEPEIAALVHEHWTYVTDNPEIPLDVNWQAFRDFDDKGVLVTVTARTTDGELVGYVILILAPALHYQTLLQAHDDAFFLKASHRKGAAGIAMFRAVERISKDKGVARICYHEKNKVPMGKVFKFLKYRPRETIWMKEI